MLVRRLLNRVVGECLGYFRCLYVLYGVCGSIIYQVEEYYAQKPKIFIHEIFIQQSFSHHKQLWQLLETRAHDIRRLTHGVPGFS